MLLRAATSMPFLVLVACSAAPRPLERGTPLGTSVRARVGDVPAHGFEVEVIGREGGVGELLAVHRDAVFIMNEGVVYPIFRRDISIVFVEVDVGPALEVRPERFDALYQYARFPQGMPPEWIRAAHWAR